MIALRLGVPVVPVRIEGLDKVLYRSWRMARPGRVRVAFGAPVAGGAAASGQPQRPAHETGHADYEALARQVEDAVRAL
jgi:1-acyl-sn-glycerol-3-phosphate acyltransferase